MVIRWTLPRIRLDQVMHLCLKVLLPFSIACVVGASAWQLALGDHQFFAFKTDRSTKVVAAAPAGESH
jgi:hypothetical protein